MKNRCIQMGNLKGGKWNRLYEECRRFYDPEGISPTLPTNGGGHHEVKIGEIKPVLVGGIGDKKSNSGTQFYQQDRIYSANSIAMAHPAQIPGGSYMYEVEENLDKCRERESYGSHGGISDPLENTGNDNLCVETIVRVRRLTEKECWRLMGFDDEDFEKARHGVSSGQLYKQAGNSIVVNVLEAIFTNLKPYFV